MYVWVCVWVRVLEHFKWINVPKIIRYLYNVPQQIPPYRSLHPLCSPKAKKKTTLVPVSVPVFLPPLLSIQFRRVRIFKTLKYPSDRAFARKKVESTFANLNSAKQKRKTEKRNSQPSRKKGKMKKQKRQKDKVQQGYARLRLPRGRWFVEDGTHTGRWPQHSLISKLNGLAHKIRRVFCVCVFVCRLLFLCKCFATVCSIILLCSFFLFAFLSFCLFCFSSYQTLTLIFVFHP